VRLSERFWQTVREGAKFGIVGLIGIGVTNAVFIPLHSALGYGPLTSVTIATLAATVVTFVGNRYWSFAHREGAGTGREGATFFLLNGIGLLIYYAVLGFSNYVLGRKTGLENIVALNLAIGLGTLFRFWSYRKWVWVTPEERLRQLRRGRHRRGRTTPVPPPVPQSAQPVSPLRPVAAAPTFGMAAKYQAAGSREPMNPDALPTMYRL
jgi:putative flippase GtrA